MRFYNFYKNYFKIIGSALNGDYEISIMNGKINIGMRFYPIKTELIQPELQLTGKNKFPLAHEILNFHNKVYKYLKVRFIINLDILDWGFGYLGWLTLQIKSYFFNDFQ